MSACEDNDELLGEGLQTDGYNGCGKKKPTSERSSTELPPVEKKKQDHRAEVWQHFIQREDYPSIINCQYYVQEIDVRPKKWDKPHEKPFCSKLYLLYKESGSKPILGGDSSGVMTKFKYDAGLFRRSVY